MSHDIAARQRLIKCGGFGYNHIPTNVVRLARVKGFDQELIDQITVHNPAAVLTIR